MGEHQSVNWREHMLKRTITRFREDGAADIFSAIRKRLAFRKPSQLRGLKGLLPLFRNGLDLQIADPSSVFKAEGLMPLYPSPPGRMVAIFQTRQHGKVRLKKRCTVAWRGKQDISLLLRLLIEK